MKVDRIEHGVDGKINVVVTNNGKEERNPWDEVLKVKIRFKYVKAYNSKGKTYYYFRRGSVSIRLDGAPGSSQFNECYAMAIDANGPSKVGAWPQPTRLGREPDRPVWRNPALQGRHLAGNPPAAVADPTTLPRRVRPQAGRADRAQAQSRSNG
jgi:hypothetical protein